MNSSITNKKIKETTYGRPRLLSHEGILESAVELGLEKANEDDHKLFLLSLFKL